jgi:hypothetical protein
VTGLLLNSSRSAASAGRWSTVAATNPCQRDPQILKVPLGRPVGLRLAQGGCTLASIARALSITETGGSLLNEAFDPLDGKKFGVLQIDYHHGFGVS